MQKMASIARLVPIALVALAASFSAAEEPPAPAGAPVDAARWVNISDPVIKSLDADHKKLDWPGVTAGVTVDPTTGDVYMVVPGQGLWKSSDHGATFARCDGGKIGGRCETGYSLNFDTAGSRLACFMLDGTCGVTADAGKTWEPFAGVGRNWDYAAVDWPVERGEAPKNIFAARHESGGEIYLSTDSGKSWKMIGKDEAFAAAGIFDARTLVATKGKGVLRSTDGGSTWTKVSDLTPVGRVMYVFNGTAYWLGREGLIVSKDKGVTWAKQGAAVEATLGLWFKDDKHIVAAGKKGFFETTDAGETWKPVAPLPPKFEFPKPGWYVNAVWDPTSDIFYASQMGKPTYKLDRGK